MNWNFSLDDKISAIELLIEDLRWARGEDGVPEHRTYWALKAVAEDLRARQRHTRVKAMDDLETALRAANASKSSNGYEMAKLRFVAETFIGHAAVVRQAMEQFAIGAEVEG
jgi:hypothetical protein